MHSLTTTITTELFESLTYRAAMWDLHRAEMLPEFRASLVLIVILGAAVVALMYLLIHATRENTGLHSVVDQMHAEDLQREKFPESVKEADSRVEFTAHKELK